MWDSVQRYMTTIFCTEIYHDCIQNYAENDVPVARVATLTFKVITSRFKTYFVHTLLRRSLKIHNKST